MNISNQLRAARKLRGLSQKALAERLNLNAANISYYEMPTTNHSVSALRKLADALDCDLYVGIVPKLDTQSLWDMEAYKLASALKITKQTL